MQLRQPPSTQPTPTGRTPSFVATTLIVSVASLALATLIWLRTDASRTTGNTASDAGHLREVASKLKAAGALDQAAALYADYLNRANLPPEARAKIATSLGSLYLEAGQYEHALRWLYEAESAAPAAGDEQLGKHIVHALERLGRVHAAKAALAARVELDAQGQPKRADADPVVARIGEREVRASDITRALDDLPPELSKLFSGSRGQLEFLRKYVADELLLRKAQKLEYDNDPELRRRLESMQRQVVVNAFIDKEIVGKVAVDAADLKSYFEANRVRYDQAEAAKLRVLKVKTEAEATQLKKQIDAGADFAKLAKQSSIDSATRGGGGLIDRWVSKGEPLWPGMNAEQARALGDAVFAAAQNATTAPLAAEGGFCLLRVEAKRPAKEASFDAVKAQVEHDYRMMKTQAAYQKLVEDELANEDVELFADRLTQVN